MTAGPTEGALPRGVALAVAAAIVVTGMRFDTAVTAAWEAVATLGPAPWRLVGERAADDVLLAYGYPLDAVLALPLRALPGAWTSTGAWLWVTLAGASAAWMGGRWWGCPWASLACGLAWMAVADASTLATTALLPLALGLFLRAFDRDTAGAIALAAFALAGLCVVQGGQGARQALLALLPAVVLAGRSGASRPAIGALLIGVGAAVLIALPLLAWGPSPAPSTPVLPPALALFGLAGVLRARRAPRRVVLPGLLVVAGVLPVALGGPSATPVASLGCALLAGGLVAGGPQSARGRRPPIWR